MKFKISNQCWENRGLDGLVAFILEEAKTMIKASLNNEGIGEFELTFKKIPKEKPAYVIFTDCKECVPQKVKEYTIMPSGEIVVKVEEGESFWFDEKGKHPKSYLVFEE